MGFARKPHQFQVQNFQRTPENFEKTDTCLGIFRWKMGPMSGDFLQETDTFFSDHPHMS